MPDITHPTSHGHYAALVTHPGYYYLYALYADYPLNNTWFSRREYAALLKERLRVLQPLLGLVQPYRKSPALRLFTERSSRERFPPDKAEEAWRELRTLIERAGPPPGWPEAPAPPSPRYRHQPPEAESEAQPAEEKARSGAGNEPRRKRPFPKSPVDYTMDV